MVPQRPRKIVERTRVSQRGIEKAGALVGRLVDLGQCAANCFAFFSCFFETSVRNELEHQEVVPRDKTAGARRCLHRRSRRCRSLPA